MLSSVTTHCPYCAEPIELLVDPSLASQSYIEDCSVCCRPMTVVATVDEDGQPQVHVRAENDV